MGIFLVQWLATGLLIVGIITITDWQNLKRDGLETSDIVVALFSILFWPAVVWLLARDIHFLEGDD